MRALGPPLRFEVRRISRSPMRALAIVVFLLSGVYAIGSGLLLAGDDPVVGPATVPDPLLAVINPIEVTGVTSTGAISRVLAVILQPDGSVLEVELQDQGDGVFNDFTAALCGPPGDYTVSVFAVDADGNVSQPATASGNRAEGCDTEFLFMDGFE